MACLAAAPPGPASTVPVLAEVSAEEDLWGGMRGAG